MAHRSLYRQYRPQGFDDVVGQAHITRTLRNAVADDAVAHAYLFTGPRGTGKTTTARILAKALECESGPTPDPDLTCEQCIDIAEGRHPDVHELDAASRTGVDNVREEIIGRLQYAPTRGRWKVYIIDEVHMLSAGAFNALLKSIEEPPPHTVFILCTTHPHKVPETIHSRCQRFDFHRIGVDDIVTRLAHIAEEEGIQVAEGSLALIAKHAGGGMRDAITNLEQLATFTGKNVTLADVEGLLGEVDSALLFELADLVADRDIAGAFRLVAHLASSGADIGEFVRDFTSHVRDLYVAAAVGDATGIVDLTSEQLSRLTSQSARFGADRLARVLDILGELSSQVRWTPDPRLALEVALTRMARPHGDLTVESLAERIDALEAGTSAAPPAASLSTTPALPREEPASAPGTVAPKAERPQESAPGGVTLPGVGETAAEPAVVEARSADALDRAHVKRAWPAIMAELRKVKASRATFFVNTEVDVDADGRTLVVEFPVDSAFTMKQAEEPGTRAMLLRALGAVLGFQPPVRFQLGRGPVREAAPEPGAAVIEERPAAGGDETEFVPPAETSRKNAGTDDVERLLVDELGAEFVAEHPHQGEGEENSER